MKRALDLCLSVIALLILLPVFAFITLCVYFNFGSPILFTQTRAGLHGRPFTIFKFRTMKNVVDSQGQALPDALRLTNFGRLLRSTSLDELPQLWCVLKGDMSLVGPRPLPMSYLPLYNPEQSRRHDVRPGITGWAQVNGRNGLGWPEKFSLDVWYVFNHSVLLDLKIIYLTVKKVISREGISANGEVTMAAFSGAQVKKANKQ